jgi:hypothetical protein
MQRLWPTPTLKQTAMPNATVDPPWARQHHITMVRATTHLPQVRQSNTAKTTNDDIAYVPKTSRRTLKKLATRSTTLLKPT